MEVMRDRGDCGAACAGCHVCQKPPHPEGLGSPTAVDVVRTRLGRVRARQSVAMVMNRILERPPRTPTLTWGGTDPFLSRVKDIQRRSPGTAPRPAGLLERWMKHFGAPGFARGAIPGVEKPASQAGPLNPHPAERGTTRLSVDQPGLQRLPAAEGEDRSYEAFGIEPAFGLCSQILMSPGLSELRVRLAPRSELE
jgi:hypothetical protein